MPEMITRIEGSRVYLTPDGVDQLTKFVMIRKLEALRTLVGYMTMTPPIELDAEARAKHEPEFRLFIRIAEAGYDDPMFCACVLLMAELLWPGYRKTAPAFLLGPALERGSPEVYQWRKAVLKRDGKRCVVCGSTKGLEAHHINRWVDAPSLRVDVDNGVTLCGHHHKEAHHHGAH